MSAEQFLSRRVKALEPSATLAMSAKAKKLAAEGKSVISFSVGEPDFKTPAHICEAAKKAIDAGLHGYTVNAGLPELRQAVADTFKRNIGVEYKASQIVVSPGAKYSLYLAMMALLDEGDEVIIPAPFWVSYPEMVKLCGATPVIVPTREADGFAVTAASIEAAVTPRTKLLILNSPSNPSGEVTPPEMIAEIARVLEKRNIWCLSDEIYDKLIYGGAKHKSIASVSDYCRDHSIVVNGCSKTYAMTGWRIGWTAAPQPVASVIDGLQSQSTSNACSIAQAAAVAALTSPQDCLVEMVEKFAERRDLVVGLLNDIPGVTCRKPGGAFYVFPNISGLFGKVIAGKKIESATDFCNVALDKAYVAMVSGEPFGSGEHARLSYAVRSAELEEGCARLKALVENTL